MQGEPRGWQEWPLRERLRVIAAVRHSIASTPGSFTAAISSHLARTEADTMVAEILPLLAAMRFLEQEAEIVLKPRRLSGRGRPIWLQGTRSQIARVPFGTVLVIGPSNYPLFLPGVQTMQALAAGNAVVWKPGTGGRRVAEVFAAAAYDCGLPREALRITDESIAAVEAEIVRGVDKVFFTGSAAVGRILLQRLSQTLTPSVMELSGCDAVIVLPSADLSRVARAVAFGMRLNGSATCMAPRRMLLVDADRERRAALMRLLLAAFDAVDGVRLPQGVRLQLASLIDDAMQSGATLHGEADAEWLKPLLIVDGHPGMMIAQADLFAPVVTLIDVAGEDGVMTAQNTCPFGLTASIFGDEAAAQRLAKRLTTVGTVLINDLIIPTADPRIPFGGRRQSGFGTTRGAEGLLEMTFAKTILMRRGNGTRRFDPTGEAHATLFRELILVLYSQGWWRRLCAISNLLRAGRQMPRS